MLLDDPLEDARVTTRIIIPITPNIIPALAMPEPFSRRSLI